MRQISLFAAVVSGLFCCMFGFAIGAQVATQEPTESERLAAIEAAGWAEILDRDDPIATLALNVAQAAHPCTVDRCIDGDTVQLTVALGFHVSVAARCRLLGYDAPEMTGPERPDGIRARDMLADLLDDGLVSVVGGDKQDKYGRFLVDLRLGDGSNPVDKLLQAGLGTK